MAGWAIIHETTPGAPLVEDNRPVPTRRNAKCSGYEIDVTRDIGIGVAEWETIAKCFATDIEQTKKFIHSWLDEGGIKVDDIAEFGESGDGVINIRVDRLSIIAVEKTWTPSLVWS